MTLARSFLEKTIHGNKTRRKTGGKKNKEKKKETNKITEELLYPQSLFRNKHDTKEQKLTQKPQGSNIRPLNTEDKTLIIKSHVVPGLDIVKSCNR